MIRKLMIATTAVLLIGAGPISKFDGRVPDAEIESQRSMGDVERCLINLNGVPAPQVYRQPDRPDDVTLLWIANGPLNGSAIGRADLRKVGAHTHVKLWLKDAAAKACAAN